MSPVLRAHLALVIAMILWGSSFIALKIAVTSMPAMQVIFLRMLIGSVACIVIIMWMRPTFHYHKGDWKYFMGMAIFEPCLYFLFEAKALQYTSAGQAGMITAMLPLMVAVAAFFIYKEHNTKRQWFGFLIALVGVIWMSLSTEDSDQAPNALLGNALEFAAIVMAVGYTMFVKHLVQRYHPFLVTAFQCFVGCIFFLPLASLDPWPVDVPLNAIAMTVYLGLVVSLGAYGFYNYSLQQLKASTAAGYVNFLPVISLMFSMWLLGEQINTIQWLAIGVIFFGVYLSRERKTRSETDELPPAAIG